jgi:UDP-N-acetylmuramyl pentapeptide phosphotransferase/UDP-N-acetylglucosamine-1-phosphate transferase
MFIPFLYAFFISLLTLWVVIYLSHRYLYFIDCSYEEKPQKFHHTSVPRAGGIGIVVALFVLLLSTPLGMVLIPSMLLVFASGIYEDFYNASSPRWRLMVQSFAGVMAMWLTNSVVTYLGLGITMPYWLGLLFSLFAMVGMINAINIIDGFNGLASGVVLLILGSFALVAWEHQDDQLFTLILVTAGATFALFLLVFPKGKIFLGDGGAYLLGFMVALIGIDLAGHYDDVSPWYILGVFIYPVFEVLFSIVRKISMGISPMQPDSYHMHMLVHRQMTRNNPLTALVILVMVTPFVVVSTYYSHCSLCNLKVVLLFILCYLLLYRYLYKKDQRLSK